MMLRSLLLAACLTCLPISSARSAEPDLRTERARILGDYLAGSYARYLNDPKAQSRFYQDAFVLAPDDIRIGRLALYSALFAGDQALARETAARILETDPDESMARAIMSVDAFARGRTARVRKFATKPTADFTMGQAMKIVLGWTLVDEGKYARAREVFGDMGDSAYFGALGQLQIAKMEAQQGNMSEARKAFDLVAASGVAPQEYTLARARFEAASGDVQGAKARLKAAIADNGRADIGPAGAYLRRLDAGKRLPRLSEKAQAARALTEPAFGFFVRRKSADGAETFLRFSRWIDPDYDLSALWLGGLIEETHPDIDPGTRDDVLELYQSIDERSSYFVNAQMSVANIYFDQEEDERALVILEALAESHPSYFTREVLGRARFFREQWAEALPFYDALVESLSSDELRINPEPLRLRGIIFERLDRWSEAEADFKRVLDYQPDDSQTLNYLGYTWVDRGEHLDEAFTLIERAVELEPESGAIVDSLGWAHYKLGRYAEAKTHLETAVLLTPYSATIIDHLGDAYWRLGRKREATYQWQRALEYDPTDEERVAIQAKLDAGVDAVPAS
ncbi:tetratricopeptide repeat protein [Algimonas porphyrae]|uniref:tetratricopeptide repeat protein n=1 Tax=Algimonas porphyrae TaxID=1128113 RepID=UPI0024E09726|nr:tetratricopeptide repeat protein [Algimonas porphyrae]